MNETTEVWEQFEKVHATVNKSGGSAYLGSGAEQSSASKTFTFRYHEKFSVIQFNKQLYRIIYGGYVYNVEDYDDYLEKHLSIRILGVSKGVRFN
ncbi:MAG: head-tail adaptor protein [Parabacteroides sp.]|nr:head-tail adaptor protein [Parabacteroides sp.]